MDKYKPEDIIIKDGVLYSITQVDENVEAVGLVEVESWYLGEVKASVIEHPFNLVARSYVSEY